MSARHSPVAHATAGADCFVEKRKSSLKKSPPVKKSSNTEERIRSRFRKRPSSLHLQAGGGGGGGLSSTYLSNSTSSLHKILHAQLSNSSSEAHYDSSGGSSTGESCPTKPAFPGLFDPPLMSLVGGGKQAGVQGFLGKQSAAILSPLLNAATRAIGSDIEVFQLSTAAGHHHHHQLPPRCRASATTSSFYSSDLNLNIQIGDQGDEIEFTRRQPNKAAGDSFVTAAVGELDSSWKMTSHLPTSQHKHLSPQPPEPEGT